MKGLSTDKSVYQVKVTKGQKTSIKYNGRSPNRESIYQATIKDVIKKPTTLKKIKETQSDINIQKFQAD